MTGRRGFTLLEVLIAVFVLSIGLAGILALHGEALRVSGGIVEDAFATSLARSVYHGVRAGARRRPILVHEGAHLVRGLVLVHDGVSDGPESAPPAAPRALEGPEAIAALGRLRASDHAIFLPRGQEVFVFPRPGGAASENAGTGTDDLGPEGPRVRRVYALGPAPGSRPRRRDATDPYGFALAVRRASVPVLDLTADQPVGQLRPVDGLYEVEVRVYKGFQWSPGSAAPQPVRGGTLVGLVTVGPPP